MALWRTRTSLLKRYQDAIDGFENPLLACPPKLWKSSMWVVKRTDGGVWPRDGAEPMSERTDESIQVFSAFGNIAYHCLLLLDFYLSGPDDWVPPAPFRNWGSEGYDIDGAARLPPVIYTKKQLSNFLGHCRGKVEAVLPTLTDADIRRVLGPNHPWRGQQWGRLLYANCAHVIEHGGQMQRFLETSSRPGSKVGS